MVLRGSVSFVIGAQGSCLPEPPFILHAETLRVQSGGSRIQEFRALGVQGFGRVGLPVFWKGGLDAGFYPRWV